MVVVVAFAELERRDEARSRRAAPAFGPRIGGHAEARRVARRESLARVIAAKPLADYDATWGKGFMTTEQFLTIAYSSLTKGKLTGIQEEHGH